MHAKPKLILSVDDDPVTLRMRSLVLASAGYGVLTASSGEEALARLAEGISVDLVLLDYLMPGMNGDELAVTIHKRYPELPLIAVSAVAQLPPKLANIVDQQVNKQETPEVLLSAVSEVLAKSLVPKGCARTVLCVEDEQLQLQSRTALLQSAGFQVFPAHSAKTALEIFRSRPVDAVVMDYWLSGKNGTAVAEEMKRLNPRIPIVMLSGFSSLPGEGAIVDSWLRKGDVAPEDIVDEVDRLIGLRTDAQPTTNS